LRIVFDDKVPDYPYTVIEPLLGYLAYDYLMCILRLIYMHIYIDYVSHVYVYSNTVTDTVYVTPSSGAYV